MKRAIVGFLLIGFSLFLKSCNTTEPPPNGQKPTLELTLEDVSCIEAWIQLKTTNLQLPTTITLKQYNLSGDSLSQNFLLNTQDSLLYIGAFGDFVHFNGSGWKVNYQEPELNYGSYLSLDIKEELVVAVGLEYDQAVIQIATKINQ